MYILFLFCQIRYLNYYYTPASTSKLWKWHRYNKFRCGNIGTCSGYRSSNEKIACRPRFEMIYSATHVISSNIASEYWVFSLRDTLALETFPCHDSSNGNTWLRGWGVTNIWKRNVIEQVRTYFFIRFLGEKDTLNEHAGEYVYCHNMKRVSQQFPPVIIC